jgi:hypothetical protein
MAEAVAIQLAERVRAHFDRLVPAAAARDAGASGMMLPIWEDALPNVPDEELAAAAERIAAATG